MKRRRKGVAGAGLGLGFNPRLREEATYPIDLIQSKCIVSIHASVKRRQAGICRRRACHSGFNPRLREEATKSEGYSVYKAGFNPRLREEATGQMQLIHG